MLKAYVETVNKHILNPYENFLPDNEICFLKTTL